MMKTGVFLMFCMCVVVLLAGLSSLRADAAAQILDEQPQLFSIAGDLQDRVLACVPGLSYDSLVDCTIDVAGELDVFTFSGVAGERASIRMLETSSNAFQPRFELRRPDDTPLCSGGWDVFTELECTLDATGAWTIVAGDVGDDDTGAYNLYLQRLNSPVGGTGVSYDQLWSGSIGSPPEMQAYSFSGVAGERVDIRMMDTGGTLFYPEFRVYRPDGTPLCIGAGDPFAEVECTLDATGTFALFAMDNGADLTGSYSIYLQRLNSPVGGTGVSYDQLWSGSIGSILTMEAYTFSGVAGERVDIRMLDTGGTLFYPEFRVYRPDGTPLCIGAGDPFAEVECTLDATGTFALFAMDNGADLTGSYSIYLQRLNNPVGGTGVSYDQLWSGSIGSILTMEAYTFSGVAGERVDIRMLDTGGTLFYPEIRVYRPDGMPLCFGAGDPFVEVECTLDATGTFALFAMDNGADLTGSYNLYLQRLNNPIGCSTINFGAPPVTDSIDMPPEMDCFTFGGLNGDQVRVTMTDLSATVFYPEVYIIRPDGSYLCGSSGDPSVTLDCNLDASGGFAIFARESGADHTGAYSIGLNCLSGNCGFALPTITSVLPNQGYSNIPNDINIYGSGFQSAAIISLGATDLSTTFVSSTHLRAIVPAGLAPGTYPVFVTNPDGGFASLANAYTVLDPQNPNLDDLYGYDYELWVEPGTPRGGEDALLGLVVHREGGKVVLPNVDVRFYLGDPATGGTVIGTGSIPLLSPRSSASTTGVSWTPPSAGSYTIYAVIDPDSQISESNEGNNTVYRTIIVQAPAGDQLAPHVDSFSINDGASSSSVLSVTLDTTASDPAPSSGLASLLFVEFEYSQSSGLWFPVQVSSWLPYDASRLDYPWDMLPFAGMHYIQAWAADNAGNISLFPYLDLISYDPLSEQVAAGQSRIYRYDFNAGDQVVVTVTPVSGDPDLYVWAPDYDTRPPWVSNLSSGQEQVSFTAPVTGQYQIEVFGYTDTEYQFTVSATAAQTILSIVETNNLNADKPLPNQPVVPLESVPGDKFAHPPTTAYEPDQIVMYLPYVEK